MTLKRLENVLMNIWMNFKYYGLVSASFKEKS